MAATTNELSQRISAFPGDQTESQWLRIFEFLRATLSESLSTHARLGCYFVNDFPGHASASGNARIRAATPFPGIESDSWEGVLCWSGNRGARAHASVLICPFLDGSAVQPEGRLADLGPNAEVDRFLIYRFQGGSFVDSGWQIGDGPGEWAHVTVPDSIYHRKLVVTLPAETVEFGAPIYVDLAIPELPAVRSSSKHVSSKTPSSKAQTRVSLIHVNRNREGSNLSPWTANPPIHTRHAQSLSDASFPSSTVMRIRLDRFNIRGGWAPGKYHLSLRAQNFHKPTHWAWSSTISRPLKLTIV